MSASVHEARALACGVIGSKRVIAFGMSNVAPAGAVVGGLVTVVSNAGFASPLVVLLAFAASLGCASSIAEFARRLPSAGSLYTYNSRGLGPTGGFLTGWMMIAAYSLYVPAGISLTSAYASRLVADWLHVTIDDWVLFLVILAAVVLAYQNAGLSTRRSPAHTTRRALMSVLNSGMKPTRYRRAARNSPREGEESAARRHQD